MMNFESALAALKRGDRIRRRNWGEGQYVQLRGDRTRLVDGPNDRTMQWFTPDLLADDWETIA